MPIKFDVENSSLLVDVNVITPSVFEEGRGSIWTSYSSDLLDILLPSHLAFKHDKFSLSHTNVLRGIHGDHKSWKLVSCVFGEIFQVVVDMRPESPRYLSWQSFELGPANRSSVLIPPGFGNAFYVKAGPAVYHYKLAYEGDYVDADAQFTIAWNDSRLNIPWPSERPILSERDSRL